MAGNGELVQLPTIAIGWDEQNKIPHISVDWAYFQNYEFALAVLEAAKRNLENLCKQAQLRKIQEQAQQQIREVAVVQDIMKGRVT